MTASMTPSILLIADRVELIKSLESAISPGINARFSSFLWQQSTVFLKPGLVHSSSLVVAELFRTYVQGQRAEAIAFAERWQGITPVLIVAPSYWGHQIECPGYWDVAASDDISQRVKFLLKHPETSARNLDKLKAKVRNHLELPRQH